MKRFVQFALLAVALAMLGWPQDAWAQGCRLCGVATPVYYSPPAFYPRRVVQVGAYDKIGFVPKRISVAPGTTVRWVSRGQETHTVTSRNGLFNSGPLPPGASFSVTFRQPGTYRYFCRPHRKMGMVGTVFVGSSRYGR